MVGLYLIDFLAYFYHLSVVILIVIFLCFLMSTAHCTRGYTTLLEPTDAI